MKHRAIAALLALATCTGADAANTHPADLEAAGDVLQLGVPLFALGLTFLVEEGAESDAGGAQWSPQGLGVASDWLRMNGLPRHDLALALGRTELITYSLKYGIDEQRPNGGGQSFPSGHTSVAFAGAEFIRKQYGWGWAAPAYLSAGLVGWSRVAAGKHWTHDVLAGAAIGVLSNHDELGFVVPFGHGRELTVAPTLLAPGLGRPGLGGPPLSDALRESVDAPPPGIGAGLRIDVRF